MDEVKAGGISIGWTSPYQAFPVALGEIEVGFECGITGSCPHNPLVFAADPIWQKESV